MKITTQNIHKHSNCSFVGVKIQSFWEYTGDKFRFLHLSLLEKEKVFLKWKFGSESHEANVALEMTDRYMTNSVSWKDIIKMKEGAKAFWTAEKKFYEMGRRIMYEIGLLTHQPTQQEVDWEE